MVLGASGDCTGAPSGPNRIAHISAAMGRSATRLRSVTERVEYSCEPSASQLPIATAAIVNDFHIDLAGRILD